MHGIILGKVSSMHKKNSTIISIVFFFSVLNLAPYFMISCTETDGENHIENVFNRCCASSMHTTYHHSMKNNETNFSVTHCKCSINISSGEYLAYHTDKILINQNISFFITEAKGEITNERNFLSYKSESPPISVNLIKSSVLLI